MKRLLTALLLLAVCLTLAACGSAQKAEPTAAPTAAEPGSMTVEEFLNTQQGMTAANNFKNSAEAGGNCTARCYAEDGAMVFEGSFISEIAAEQLDQVHEAIDSYLNSADTAEGMQSIVEGLRLYGVADPKAKIVFRAADGTVLGEKTYA